MWSAACTIYELYTGKFLFAGESNNEMLKLILQTVGKLSLKLLKRGAFVYKYFDQNFTFLSKEKDPVTRYLNYLIDDDLNLDQNTQKLCYQVIRPQETWDPY